jgi:hypothetical protein
VPHPVKVTGAKARNKYRGITDGCGDGWLGQVPSGQESGGTAEKFELRVLFVPFG